MIIETLRLTRDVGRIHDLATILIKYGFADFVQRLGIAKHIEAAGKVLHWKELEETVSLPPQVRFRSALEEMGPTFVKLGQIFATRSDLFSEEWIREFKKLQDNVKALPYESLASQVEEDLGALPEEIFKNFGKEPIAAASMSQVYKAQLQDDSSVIVKIRRPGIRKVIESDLRLLAHLAEIIEKEFDTLRCYRPKEIIHQFSLSIHRELDLTMECRNAERMATNFEGNSSVVIPKVYWYRTSERINVQEFIDGIPANHIEEIDRAGLSREVLAKLGADAVLKMILEDGFFHADPHPGNIFCLPDNKIAFIDFGMVGRLTEEEREQLLDLLKGFVDRDGKRIIKILVKWTNVFSSKSRDNLTDDINDFIDKYHGIPIGGVDISEFLSRLTSILRENKLNLPSNLTLLLKALITLEGFGSQLSPEFNLLEVAEPFLRRMFLARYSVEALLKKGRIHLFSLVEMLTDLPENLSNLFDSFKGNSFTLQLNIKKPKWIRSELDRGINRISVSLVTAALIVGSSIVTTSHGGPSSIIGMIGFISATLGGIWLLVAIWRSK